MCVHSRTYWLRIRINSLMYVQNNELMNKSTFTNGKKENEINSYRMCNNNNRMQYLIYITSGNYIKNFNYILQTHARNVS